MLYSMTDWKMILGLGLLLGPSLWIKMFGPGEWYKAILGPGLLFEPGLRVKMFGHSEWYSWLWAWYPQDLQQTSTFKALRTIDWDKEFAPLCPAFREVDSTLQTKFNQVSSLLFSLSMRQGPDFYVLSS